MCTCRDGSQSGVLSSCQLLLTCINVSIQGGKEMEEGLMKQTDTDNDERRKQTQERENV